MNVKRGALLDNSNKAGALAQISLNLDLNSVESEIFIIVNVFKYYFVDFIHSYVFVFSVISIFNSNLNLSIF